MFNKKQLSKTISGYGPFRFAGAKLIINNEKTNTNNFLRNN